MTEMYQQETVSRQPRRHLQLTGTPSSAPDALNGLAYRVVILGNSGSGKSTLAQRLAEVFNAAGVKMKYIPMDNLLWNDGWVETPRDVMNAAVAQLTTSHTHWVIDGNYFKLRETIWIAATDFIWLDYHFILTFWQIFLRTIQRVWSGRPLFGTEDCVEDFWTTFFSKKSILWYVPLSVFAKNIVDQRPIVLDGNVTVYKVVHITALPDSKKVGDHSERGDRGTERNGCEKVQMAFGYGEVDERGG